MKVKWLILGAAITFAVLSCAALGIGYVLKPSTTVWVILVAVAAISLEVLFWVAAGVFGWSFLANRRAAIDRIRARLFGKQPDSRQTDATAPSTDPI